MILDVALGERKPTVVRFLAVAVVLERPDVDALVSQGVPKWDAIDLLRRLAVAGEIVDGTWIPTAREAYRRGLDAQAQRALERRDVGERPREKALIGGIESLDDAELLALLLRTGTGDEGVLELARRLLDDQGGLVGLARAHVAELAEARGLGPAKAGELAAAFELGRRLREAALRERPELRGPEAVAAFLAPLAVSLPHEEFWCLPLDARCRLIGLPRVIGRGDVDGTDAPPRAFFRAALSAGAVSVIAVHNHPSGDPTPSAADKAVTRRLVAAGRTVELAVNDHVILGDGGRYVSLRRDCPELWA